MGTTVDDLRAALHAEVSSPEDAGYAAATPWNRAIDVRPFAVVHAESAEDVAAALRWAGAHGRRIMVQRTGHGPTPIGDDVVLVNTARLSRIVVDPEARSARVGGGATAGEVIDAAAAHGLTAMAGSSTNVGLAGLISGGGLGPMCHTHGLASDWVRALTVVTGDGTIRRAAPDDDADLFWGMRGGKATLGIMTELEVELAPFSSFFGGGLYFAAEDVARVVAAWAPWAERLPREGTTSLVILQLPEAPGVPEPLAGKMTVCVRFVWLGDESEGARLGGELLAAADPVFGGLVRMSSNAIGMVHADPTEPMPIREDGLLLSALPAEAAEAFVAAAGPESNSPLALAEIRRMDLPSPRHEDAFCGRWAAYNLMTIRVPLPEPTSGLDASDAVLDALRPWATGAVMPNFVISDNPALQPRYWDAPTLQRLRELGDRYDPAGVLIAGQTARLAAPAIGSAAD